MRDDDDAPSEGDLPTTLFLLREHARGAPRAFAELYARHAHMVARSVATRLGQRLRGCAELEDVMQETFLAAWQHLERGGDEPVRTLGCFRALLAKIALQKAIDALRRAERLRRDHRREGVRDLAQLTSEQERPSRFAVAAELRAEIDEALLALDADDRFVLDCRDNLGLGYAAIARELGTTSANAKLRCHRARERLRMRIAKRWPARDPHST
ncbi:MAG: sigma-70 family RNA polymerase sigma factor [Planctomycetes bacterium]|nr:sigma-70 family RNA polymerase sigma factor [Planctomycetota bacterium]